MVVELNAVGLWAFAVAVVAWLLAIVVYRARPDRWQNRFVAVALVLEPFLIHDGAGWAAMLDDPATVYALAFVRHMVIPAFQVAYLGFLATLETPLARPLRHRAARVVAVVYVAAYWIVVVARPAWVVTRVVPGQYVPWVALVGPLWRVAQVVFLAVFAYGLAVAVSAWRRADRGSAIRERNRWFAMGFGVRDLGIFGLITIDLFTDPAVTLAWAGPVQPNLDSFPALVMFLMLGYGVLKVQLFDVDLKVKWTLERSTVAAVFVAVFFVVSEGAQVLFAGIAGSEILGVLAAGALVFLLSPLQRLAARLGDAAMPGVEDTPQYREGRKQEIYRALLEELMADEQITKKERRALHRLQDDLALDGETANRLEREVVGAMGGEA